MRTTINIDDTVLRELKKIQGEEGRPLGLLVSELLTVALAARKRHATRAAFQWTVQDMGARFDVADRNALEDALDEPLP